MYIFNVSFGTCQPCIVRVDFNASNNLFFQTPKPSFSTISRGMGSHSADGLFCLKEGEDDKEEEDDEEDEEDDDEEASRRLVSSTCRFRTRAL